jgi:hypothetical protein
LGGNETDVGERRENVAFIDASRGGDERAE